MMCQSPPGVTTLKMLSTTRRFQSDWWSLSATRNRYNNYRHLVKGQIKKYFGDYANKLSKAERFTEFLLALDEKPIHDEDRTYRYMLLSTFDHPFSVRIKISSNNKGTLYAKKTGGKGGYGPGKLTLIKEVSLNEEETSKFTRKVEECEYWETPAYIEEPRQLDGSTSLFEGVEGNRFHAIGRDRNNKCFSELGEMFVKMSGMD